MELILASASPRRRELMNLITPHYCVETSDVDESALRADTPAALSLLLAGAKCGAVAALHPAACVIGCDTVVDVDGAVLEKPKDKDDARRMISTLAGRTHRVHTGVCITAQGRSERFVCTTAVTFAPMSGAQIEAYISTPEPYDKAGGYGIQGGVAKYVTRVEGCFYNVMGFPVAAIYETLQKMCVNL